MADGLWDVSFHLKSGAVVVVQYDEAAVVEEVKEMLIDPVLRQYELEDDAEGTTTVIPRRNVDYIEVKSLVQ